MSFLDPTDITSLNGTNTPPRNVEGEQPTLNEEVNQVMGQLGSFWGGLRKQSQAALESARKVDFAGVVTQAQKELTKLTTTAPEGEAPVPTDTNKSEEDSATLTDRSPTPTASSSTPQTFLARFQSALPPNVVSTVQNHIPDSIKHASEHGIDFSALRNNLQTEFTRVQGVTRAQAEEYVRQSEVLFRETLKEAQDVLRDAVTLVPPEASSAQTSGGVVWDGSDIWMLPSDASENTPSSSKGKGKASMLDSQRAVATRAEALLKRLKHDPLIIRHDPEADPAVKELYVQWLAAEVDTKENGIEGKEWTDKANEVLADGADGEALKANRDTLVPSDMANDVFWKRYFFRVHQTEREEEKRKALLAGSNEEDEDFSWEDDEEESASPTTSKPHATAPSDTKPSSTPNTMSPRDSSEESYDLVSSGNASAAESAKPPAKGKDSTTDSENDSDSDWE
ncbi:hypothetical protein DL96DRAFT_1497575 [Flagelloscypha sp. PMI_526]|nr:hypothetical protein DL96DRAFT_1497575 [Flagelloscypha sp. PMI_526]